MFDILFFLMIIGFVVLIMFESLKKNSLQKSWDFMKEDKAWIVISPEIGSYQIQNNYVSIFYQDDKANCVKMRIQNRASVGEVVLEFQNGVIQSIVDLTVRKNSGFTVSENFICCQILMHAQKMIQSLNGS